MTDNLVSVSSRDTQDGEKNPSADKEKGLSVCSEVLRDVVEARRYL